VPFFTILLGGFVGEHEAGQRLFQAVHDPRCAKSGVYWSWNGGPREGRGAEAVEKDGQISGSGGAGGGWDSIFENDQSGKVLNIDAQMKLFETATQITGADWPALNQITSPCPTLMVIGAVTQGMVKREELKRMQEMGRPGMEAIEEKPKISKRKKVVAATDRVVSGVLTNTVGRVARFAGRRVLGEIPEEAKTGSYHQNSSAEDATETIADLEGAQLIEQAIAEQLQKENKESVPLDTEDEALFRELLTGKKEEEKSVNAVY
jgi:hypothetical protein